MWPALIGLGTALFSAYSAKKANDTNLRQASNATQFNAEQAQINRDFEADQAQKQRDFQLEASNTAHQREVADLRAAGLNPLLSLNGGASSPVGAMAGGSSASAVAGHVDNPFKDTTSDLINSARVAMEMQMNDENIKTARSQQLLNSAQAAKIVAETKPKSMIAQGLENISNVIANSARWLGGKTARIDFPRLVKS